MQGNNLKHQFDLPVAVEGIQSFNNVSSQFSFRTWNIHHKQIYSYWIDDRHPTNPSMDNDSPKYRTVCQEKAFHHLSDLTANETWR